MELWIRSRDKRFIVKVTNGIFINKCYKNGYTDGYEITCGCGGELGIYSEKKALEILDEIQDLMRSLTDSDLKIIIYEMPKE